jgi:hypothetical protein
MLCNTLEENGVQPEKVLRKAGLAGAEWNAPATVTALFAATHPYFTESVPCDSDTDQDDDSASDYNSSLSLLFMGSVQGLFSFFSVFFSLYASSGFLCGGHVPLYLSSLPGRR